IDAYLATCAGRDAPLARSQRALAFPVVQPEPAPSEREAGAPIGADHGGGSRVPNRLRLWLAPLALTLVALSATSIRAEDDMGAFVSAIRLVQLHGTEEAVRPEYDARTKGQLSKALGKDGDLRVSAVGGLIDPEVLARLG